MRKRGAYCCYKIEENDDCVYIGKYLVYSCKRCYLNIVPTKHKIF